MTTIVLEGYDELVKKFTPELVMRANAQAIRKTLAKTRTFTSSLIRDDYTIKARDVKAGSFIRRLSLRPPGYELVYQGSRISMEKFQLGTRGVRTVQGWRRRAITVRITKKRKIVKGGFAIRGYAAYLRKGKARNKIEKRTTLALPQMVNTKSNSAAVFAFMGKELPLQFKPAMDEQLYRAGWT